MNDRCIICNSENVEKYEAKIHPFILDRMFAGKNFEEKKLCHCRDCDMWWSSFRPTNEEMARYYKNYMKEEYNKARDVFDKGFLEMRNKYDAQNGFEKELQTRKVLMKDLFKKYIDFSKINSVLDYGGARGEFIIDEFKDSEKFVYDVDVTEPVNGIKKLSFEDMHKKKYDFIQCCHTLEHVSYPMDIITEMVNLLSDEGYLYIEVPYEDYMDEYLNKNKSVPIHEHINLFRKDVFEKIFNNINFGILELEVIKQDDLFGQNKIIRCLVRKIKSYTEAINLNKLYKISDLIRQNNEDILELKSLLQKRWFEIYEEQDHKVIKILGFKIKYRNKR